MNRIIVIVCLSLALPLKAIADEQNNTADEPKSAQVQTQPQDQYQVELMIFRYINGSSHLEDWQSPTLMNTANSIDLVLPEFSVENQTPNYCLLPKTKLLLNKEQERLEQSSDFNVILHIAWTQEITDNWHSKAVHIAGGKNYTIEGAFANEVEGVVSLSKTKFINFKSELCITEPSETIGFDQNHGQRQFYNLPEILSYHISLNRRMKPGELNYIDNPNFGVLVMIKPL